MLSTLLPPNATAVEKNFDLAIARLLKTMAEKLNESSNQPDNPQDNLQENKET